jgi:hypothetical protein
MSIKLNINRVANRNEILLFITRIPGFQNSIRYTTD